MFSNNRLHELRWTSLTIGLVVFAVFLNCLPNQFLWDDQPLILGNKYLTSPSYVPRFFTENLLAGAGVAENRYRPIELLTHFVDVRLWGYNAPAHHLTNVLLHAGLSCAVFRLLATLVSPAAAAAGALVFSLHPLQTMVVPVVSGRADPLVLLFICLGLLAFRRRPGASLLCAALALGSKENGILFPALLFLYDRALPRPVPLKRHLPFWALLGVYVALRLTVLNFFDTLNSMDQADPFAQNFSLRLFTYLSTLPKAVALCAWPADVHLLRSWPVPMTFADPRVLGGTALLALVATLIVLAWRHKRRAAAAGLTWFILATLPTSNLLAVTYLQFSDHWFILPGLGLVIAGADTIARLIRATPRLRLLVRLSTAAAIFSLAATTIAFNRVWRDPLTLFGSIAAYEPASGRAQHNLAMALKDAGRPAEAIPVFERALELGYDDFKPHYQLALCYLAAQRPRDALPHLERAAQLGPPQWDEPRRLIAELRSHSP